MVSTKVLPFGIPRSIDRRATARCSPRSSSMGTAPVRRGPRAPADTGKSIPGPTPACSTAAAGHRSQRHGVADVSTSDGRRSCTRLTPRVDEAVVRRLQEVDRDPSR